MLGDQRCLLGLVFRRKLLGIAARRRRIGDISKHKLGAETLHLFLGGLAHVGGRDDGPQTPRRCNGLKPGNPHTHDEHLGRRHRARRRHHHRESAAEVCGGVDHRLVARQIGLRGENVHRLGAGNPRHQFHGEGHDAGLGDGFKPRLVTIGIKPGGEDGALLQGLQQFVRRPAHPKYNVGIAEPVLDDPGASRGIGVIGDESASPSAGLHHNLKSLLHIGLDRVGAGRNALLPRLGFRGDRDFHVSLPFSGRRWR